jgi:hypothetical protein
LGFFMDLSSFAKKRLRYSLRLLPLLLLFSFATEREARAYTDPGSGMLIWQMLVAGFVGVMFYFRRLTSWFKGKKSSEATEAQEQKGPKD